MESARNPNADLQGLDPSLLRTAMENRATLGRVRDGMVDDMTMREFITAWRSSPERGVHPVAPADAHLSLENQGVNQALRNQGLWEHLQYQPYAGPAGPLPLQPPQPSPIMNGLSFDSMAQSQVAYALQLLQANLPAAFSSSSTPLIDMQAALQPLRNEIQGLREELAEMNRKYEEVLYRLETEQLAAQEMTA